MSSVISACSASTVAEGPRLPDADLPKVRPELCDAASAGSIAPDLDAWAQEVRASNDSFYGERRWRELMAPGAIEALDGASQAQARMVLAWEHLRFGSVEDAAAEVELAEDLVATFEPTLARNLRALSATVGLRQAELDNCLFGLGAVCTVDPESKHTLTLGMERAVAELQHLLDADSEEQSARWLLNVAYMGLGQWPADVPTPWRIGPELFESGDTLPVWHDVGQDVSQFRPTALGSAAIADLNGDGRVDLLGSSFVPGEGMTLHLSVGDGTFCEASEASGLAWMPAALSFAVADFDNDGDADIAMPRGAWMSEIGSVRPSLLVNDGTGRFTDTAVDAGLADIVGPSQVVAWADVDGDGWLDLYFGREEISDDGTSAPASMYINQHDGTFTDEASSRGLANPGFVKGATFGDIDNDGDLDLFVSTMRGDNHLMVNDGLGVFSDHVDSAVVARPDHGFNTWFFDYDQDGWQDLYVNAYPLLASDDPLARGFFRSIDPWVASRFGDTYAETPRLFRNNQGRFEDVTFAMGLSTSWLPMGSNHGDIDADGFPDIYLGTGAPALEALQPNAMLRNRGGNGFEDVALMTRTAHLQKGHGVAFGDLDEDGDEDLFVDMGGAYQTDVFRASLFENPTIQPHGLTLRLEGVVSNRDAVGARVAVRTTSGRVIHYAVGIQGSFGDSSRQVEVAIGRDDGVESVTILWPSGESEVLEDLSLATVVHVREGSGVVDVRPWNTVRLGG